MSDLRPENFQSVGDWYAAVRASGGGVPLQMCAGIEQVMKKSGLSFAEAFRALQKQGTIVLTEQGENKFGKVA